MICKLIESMQELLKIKGLTSIIIPTHDFHMTEYVGSHFKGRAHFSGFTGSVGVLFITTKSAHLWVDGRYFIQAATQLEGTGIELMKEGEPNVPTLGEFLKKNMTKKDVLCFDGRILSASEGEEYTEIIEKVGGKIYSQEDLVGQLWKNRPELSKEPAFMLDIKYSGKSSEDKIADIRKFMEEKNVDVHLIGTLDEVAWLYNIRGGDIEKTPFLLSFAAITKDEAILFVNAESLDEDVKAKLKNANISVKPYEDIYTYAGEIPTDKLVMLDKKRINFNISNGIRAEILNCPNPSVLMKAMKNPVELENTRIAHIQDGVAVTKLMYWLKTNIGKMEITEISVADKIAELRAEQKGFLDLSFITISGYKEHGAMMHYIASAESNSVIKAEGMLLVDSGGQYMNGTTDITRTFVLGAISDEHKTHFTSVVRGVIAITTAKFLYGCNGLNLDILARAPMWDLDLDYKCGTGHGVGHISVIHEKPNSFRWKTIVGNDNSAVFEEGMVTTVEPGIYIEDSHGTRTENELVCHKGTKNEYGQFMEFETITFAPIDLDGIVKEIMTAKEIAWLNDYHTQVFAKISPYLEPREAEWLQEATRAI